MAERLVVDVGAQLAASLFREADAWEAKDDLLNAEKARDAARAQLQLAGLPSRGAADADAEKRVPLTAAETTQQTADNTASAQAVAEKAAAAAVADTLRTTLRDKRARALTLADKLDANTATAVEQREALALALRGLVRLTRLHLNLLDQAD